MLGWGCHSLEFVEIVVVPFADGVAVAVVVAFVLVVAAGVAAVVVAVVTAVAVVAVVVIAAVVVANEPFVVAEAVAESFVADPSEIETVAYYLEY